jgi:hypothetical protein
MSWIITWGAFSLSVFAVARVAHGDCGRGGLWDPEICLLLGPGFLYRYPSFSLLWGYS